MQSLKINFPNQEACAKQKTNTPLWWVKITQYEYWPWLLIYAPMLFVWLWNVIRTRKLAYFTAINPGFTEGGFYGESKKAILDRIPNAFKPVTMLINKSMNPIEQIKGLAFPLIAKPDIGERGNGVEKIKTSDELLAYHQAAKADYIVQSYVDYPLELAVLYSKLPGEVQGKISSVTIKGFLSVTGDGFSTLEELMYAVPRARQQMERLKPKNADRMQSIVPNGERIELESIGNHCRGTRFIKANHLITPEFEGVFEHISAQIYGFQYGRFDLRVSNMDDLLQLKNIQIVELNGVSADPAHIYDNAHGLFRTYCDLIWHWNRIGKISQYNLKHGRHAAAPRQIWEKFKSRNL